MFALDHGDLWTSSYFLRSLIIGVLLYLIFKKSFHTRRAISVISAFPQVFSKLAWAILHSLSNLRVAREQLKTSQPALQNTAAMLRRKADIRCLQIAQSSFAGITLNLPLLLVYSQVKHDADCVIRSKLIIIKKQIGA